VAEDPSSGLRLVPELMQNLHNARAAYERPRIVTYGTLRDITAQLEHALPAGIGVAGASSVPTGGPPPGEIERPPPGPSPEGNPPSGFGGEESFGGGGGGESGVGGAEQGGGGAGSGGGGGGETVSGSAAELPFTGFPAAVAAAVGAGMASAGAALRRALKRR
jgi:hypothetical protein